MKQQGRCVPDEDLVEGETARDAGMGTDGLMRKIPSAISSTRVVMAGLGDPME